MQDVCRTRIGALHPTPFYEQRSRVKPISACAQVQRRDGSSFYCGSYSADHGFGGNGGIFYTSGVKPRWAVDARHAISVRCCWTFDSRAFLISSDRRRSQRFFCAADPNQLSRYTSMLIHAIPRHMEACCGGGCSGAASAKGGRPLVAEEQSSSNSQGLPPAAPALHSPRPFATGYGPPPPQRAAMGTPSR